MDFAQEMKRKGSEMSTKVAVEKTETWLRQQLHTVTIG